MARPSVKEERAAEILDAFERCVVKYGVEGAGLQRIADEAGLARPLLRHHVGNREDLLDALVERFTERSQKEADELAAWMPEHGRVEALIDILFDPRYQTSRHDILLYQALMVAAQTRPKLRRTLKRWYEETLEVIRLELDAQFPRAAKGAVEGVALGIVALYFNADAMSPLTSAKQIFTDSRQVALRLLGTL